MMKLRVIEDRKRRLILCPNGSIMKADKDALAKLLTGFRKPTSFKGDEGYWNGEITDMEDVYGVTLAYVDEMSRLVILSDKLFEPEKTVVYVTVTEYAELHGRGIGIVKRLCLDGRIEGAIKKSNGWLIPKDTPYPERKPRGST